MTSNAYKKILLTLRVVMILTAVFTVGILVKKDLVLSGSFQSEHDFLTPSPFFTELVPKDRVEVVGQQVKIKKEPVYTTLRYPRPFKNLDLQVEFSNPDDLFIEMGPQNNPIESYDLHALNHPELNKYDVDNKDWGKSTTKNDEQIDLIQKRSAEYQYLNLEQFYENLPDIQNVGYFGVKWPQPFVPQFSEGQSGAEITVPLRGGHEFYIATNKDTLEFVIVYSDTNNTKGGDEMTITLSDWDDQVIDEWIFNDDGEVDKHKMTTANQIASFKLSGLNNPAVYKVKVKTSEDVYMQKIQSNSQYIVVYGRLWIAGGPDYLSKFALNNTAPVTLYTNAREWVAFTNHRDTLQEIRLVQETLPITEPLVDFKYATSPNKRFILNKGYPLMIEKGNIELTARGVFAFNQNQYFSPTPWLIDHTVNIEELGLQYIIVRYTPPNLVQENIFAQQIPIDLENVFALNKNLRVQISIPSLQPGQSVGLNKITADYTSEPVTLSNFWDKLRRFVNREIIK